MYVHFSFNFEQITSTFCISILMTCRYFFWYVLDVKPQPFHFQKLNQWTRTGGRDPTCVFSLVLSWVFVLLIRGIGSGLHSWVNLSPQKTYRNDLLLQVMCTIFVSTLTEVLRVLPCVYMYVCMHMHRWQLPPPSPFVTNTRLSWWMASPPTRVPRDWPELRLSQPVSWGPLVVLTLDKNSPSKYTAGTMRTWDCTLLTVFCSKEGWRLVLLCSAVQAFFLCYERCKYWSYDSLWYQGHRLEM